MAEQNDDLERIVSKSQVVRCPNFDCNDYGSFRKCYDHTYCLCNEFKDFYADLSPEQIKKIFGIK